MKRRVLTRASALFMASILAMPTVNMKAVDAKVLVDENFEDGVTDAAILKSGEVNLTLNEGDNKDLTITGRTKDYYGIQIVADEAVGSKLSASVKVKGAAQKVVLQLTYKHDVDGASKTEYKWVANGDVIETEYTTLEGTYDVPEDATDVKLQIVSNGTAIGDITLDDFTVSYVPVSKEKVLVEDTFEDSEADAAILASGGVNVTVAEQSGSNKELVIANRTAAYHGVQVDANVTAGSKLSASAKVRGAAQTIVLQLTYKQEVDGESKTEYKWIANGAVTEADYTTLAGTYDVPADATDIKVQVVSSGNTDAFPNIMVDDLKISYTPAEQVVVVVPPTNEDFEGETNIALARGPVNMTVEAGAGVDGSKALFITDRVENWNGVNFDVLKYAGQKVTFTAKVKSKDNPLVSLSIQQKVAGAASYTNVTKVTTGTDEYVTITGSCDVDADAEEAFLYLESGTLESFYVDDVNIVGVPAAPKKELVIQKDIPDLKSILSQETKIGGKTGVALPAKALNDAVLMELVTKHYNSITAENEMKPDSILGSAPQFEADGTTLKLNFSNADLIMDKILAYNTANPENKIGVRGHVLVWHSQTPTWFFKEGYSQDADAAYVTPEVMLERMDSYIKTVIGHYDGTDSKYKGIIYAWDVVNEQINPSDKSAENPKSIRISNGSSGTSNWYQVFKGETTYITEAFKLANKYAPETVKLFYNDYGETDPAKCVAITELLKEIKATSGARIDGMGMQAHYNMSSPSVGDFEKAVRSYASVVDEIQLTELDLQSSVDYTGTNKDVEYSKQAYRYKEFFEKMYELDAEDNINITAVTLWGTHDGASWLQSSSVVGGGADGTRKQVPLFFDDEYQAKPAYWAVVDPSKLTPNINETVALEKGNDNWDAVPENTFAGGSFKTVWTENGLEVRVNVKDTVKDAGDKVTVYYGDKATLSVTRDEATATEDGYVATVTVPGTNQKVGDVVKLDVVVIDDAKESSWTDLTNSQDESTEYYGKVTLKPYGELAYGTPNLTDEGVLDGVWDNQPWFNLSVKTGSPEATAKAKAMWDEEYLYVYAEVTDPILSKKSVNPWEQDSLEIFVDQNNGKTSSYEKDDCQYRINFDNEKSLTTGVSEDNITSVTATKEGGYAVEAKIKLTDITPKAGTLLGLDFQINDDTGSGSRAGTYNWYDHNGSGYGNTSVFGTVKLLAKEDGGNTETPVQKNKISYVLHLGTNNSENPSTYTEGNNVTLKNPTRSGCVFLGWYTGTETERFKTKVTTVGPTGDVTVYAKWAKVEPKYNISYVLHLGKNNSGNPATFVEGKQVTLKNPTRSGCVFLGWYMEKTFKTKVTTVGIKGNVTVYAKWARVTVGKPVISSFLNTKKGQMQIKYTAVSGAKGYQIKYYANGNSCVKVATGTTLTVTSTAVRKGKLYKAFVRAYKVDSTGKKVYGSWSNYKYMRVTK